jgi:hypothetical protein
MSVSTAAGVWLFLVVVEWLADRLAVFAMSRLRCLFLRTPNAGGGSRHLGQVGENMKRAIGAVEPRGSADPASYAVQILASALAFPL